MALTRDQIKAKRGVRPRVAVEVPELGTVYVSKFSAKDRDRFEQMVTGGKVGGVNLENVRARFVAMVCVNEDGTRMFDDADAEWIGELDTDIVQAIVDKGFEMNGIGRNAVEEEAGK